MKMTNANVQTGETSLRAVEEMLKSLMYEIDHNHQAKSGWS